jgi:NitT/TauT family transport system permease protein
MKRAPWFTIRKELTPRQGAILWLASFLVPLALWCVVSYVPFVWHPQVIVTDPGSVDYFTVGANIDKPVFNEEVRLAKEEKRAVPHGTAANPVYLPTPHDVLKAMYTAYTTPPALVTDTWLHETLWMSLKVIFWGFFLSSLVGVPLGILCGTVPFFSKVSEPFIEFFRYLPAPAFGPLMVAILGINQPPKIAIVFIGTFFQQVLVIANTTRKLDMSLLEAAQTLGARNKQLVFKVVVPGIVVDLYTDMRILLGWAWTYLVIAEVFGTLTGITFFLTQQARYLHFANVYAGIISIGIIGLSSDMLLAFIARRIFPWQPQSRSAFGKMFGALLPERLRRRGAAPIAAPPRFAA